MKGFVLSDEARGDLFEAWALVAADNPHAADKLERDIMQACALLVRRPGMTPGLPLAALTVGMPPPGESEMILAELPV